MKGGVYILMIVMLAYLTESARMPYYLVAQARSTASECCHKSSSRDMKDIKGSCNPAANCTSCPLCYTAELASPYTSERVSSLLYKDYPEVPDEPLADYAASAWKPPNA